MISREEVVWLYRCLLGREPESDSAIDSTANTNSDFSSARAAIMASAEFMNNQLPLVQYRPTIATIPATKNPKNSLALVTIVKNEEKNVEYMLRSVLPVVDFMVVIDTGSTDTTIDIVQRFMNECECRYCLESIFFQDFSQARNTALDKVPDDIAWSLILDADEHLVPEDYWRLLALLDADVDGWQLPRFNFYDANKAQRVSPYPDYQRRLIRNRRDRPIRFVGAVHEQPINVEQWGIAPTTQIADGGSVGGPHIHHMGQVGLSPQRWKEKHEFYAQLARSSPPVSE